MRYRAPYPRLYCELNTDAHFGNVLRGKLLRIMRHSHENLSICGECMGVDARAQMTHALGICAFYLATFPTILSDNFGISVF